jgi:hypothetical protein
VQRNYSVIGHPKVTQYLHHPDLEVRKACRGWGGFGLQNCLAEIGRDGFVGDCLDSICSVRDERMIGKDVVRYNGPDGLDPDVGWDSLVRQDGPARKDTLHAYAGWDSNGLVGNDSPVRQEGPAWKNTLYAYVGWDSNGLVGNDCPVRQDSPARKDTLHAYVGWDSNRLVGDDGLRKGGFVGNSRRWVGKDDLVGWHGPVRKDADVVWDINLKSLDGDLDFELQRDRTHGVGVGPPQDRIEGKCSTESVGDAGILLPDVEVQPDSEDSRFRGIDEFRDEFRSMDEFVLAVAGERVLHIWDMRMLG